MANKLLLFLFFIYIPYSMCFVTEEPKCSKFDFELKLLEKMVKMEHSTGIMMEDFKKLTSQVEDSLLDMKREFSEIKQEQDQYRNLIEDYLHRPSYAFSAYWLSSTNPAIGETLIFNKILLNEKDAYNIHTGEYTVPVNGTYMFTSTLCILPDRWADMQFVADGAVIGAYRTADHTWHTCTSSAVTTYLRKDVKMKMITIRKASGVPFYNEEGHLQCSFSGHLIK